MATIRCPHCTKSIGGPANEGGFRVRLGIVIVDPESGLIKGPCPHCKRLVVLSERSQVSKAFSAKSVIPAFRIPKT